MSDTVQVEYEELMQVAQLFCAYAETFKTRWGGVVQDVGNLQAGEWEGNGANRFYQRMNDNIDPALREFIQALELSCANIKTIKDKMQQAEEEAQNCIVASLT